MCVCVYIYIHTHIYIYSGPGWRSRYSDSLRGGRSGDRIPVGVRFTAPVQTGPGAYPTSYPVGTGSLSKRPERGANHPPSSAEGKETVQLYLYSPSGPSWPVLGRTLPLHTYTYIYMCCLLFFTFYVFRSLL